MSDSRSATANWCNNIHRPECDSPDCDYPDHLDARLAKGRPASIPPPPKPKVSKSTQKRINVQSGRPMMDVSEFVAVQRKASDLLIALRMLNMTSSMWKDILTDAKELDFNITNCVEAIVYSSKGVP